MLTIHLFVLPLITLEILEEPKSITLVPVPSASNIHGLYPGPELEPLVSSEKSANTVVTTTPGITWEEIIAVLALS